MQEGDLAAAADVELEEDIMFLKFAFARIVDIKSLIREVNPAIQGFVQNADR